MDQTKFCVFTAIIKGVTKVENWVKKWKIAVLEKKNVSILIASNLKFPHKWEIVEIPQPFEIIENN